MDSDESDFSDSGSIDSDKELQIAFQQGLLKPGLIAEAAPKKEFINNVAGLQQCLSELQRDLPWVERLDVSSTPIAPPRPMAESLGANPDDLEGEGVHDDFKREMKFYRQAQGAVLESLPRLQALRIKTSRPSDYLAEMAKSDQHMKKVREKLISKKIAIERSEKAKKLRELRKYGKKVQHEVLQKRQKEKREMMDAVKKYRKGQQTQLDFLDDPEPSGKGQASRKPPKQETIHQPGKKRNYKNQKFGFGGQKKRSKYNTAQSAAEMGDFNIRKNAAVPGKQMINKNKKRPGKARRQKGKNRTK